MCDQTTIRRRYRKAVGRLASCLAPSQTSPPCTHSAPVLGCSLMRSRGNAPLHICNGGGGGSGDGLLLGFLDSRQPHEAATTAHSLTSLQNTPKHRMWTARH